MAANCTCTHTPNPGTLRTVTSNVTYDGPVLCTGTSTGDANVILESLADAICALQAIVLQNDAEDILLGGIDVATCIPITTETNLAEFINTMLAAICQIESDINTLSLSSDDIDVSTVDWASYPCIDVGPATLTDALDYMWALLCSVSSGDFLKPFFSFGGDYAVPMLPFSKDTLTITDISALGVAKVNIDPTSYYSNGMNVDLLSTNINLINSSDNYIFIDNVIDDYDVTAVAIGAASPATNGDKVCMVRTGVGTVTSITTLMADAPIDTTFIKDGSINAAKMDANAFTFPLENDGSNIILNIDTNKLDVNGGNELTIAADAITATEIDEATTFGASISETAGVYEVEVDKSIELDAVTGKVQLANDSAAPGNSYYYGTSSAGVKGYFSIEASPILVEYTLLTAADILSLHDTPIVLVPNINPFESIHVEKVVMVIHNGSFAYVSANPIEIRYTDGAGDKVSSDIPAGMITSVATKTYVVNGVEGYLSAASPVVAVVPTANPTVGNGEFDMYVYYTIQPAFNI